MSVNQQTGKTYRSDRHSHHNANTEIVYSNLTTPYSYMRSLVTDNLKVLLSGNDLTSGVKPGGSTTEGSDGSL